MDSMTDLARSAVEQMPPQFRFRESDAEIILRHRDPLLALKGEFVAGFYDVLYQHAPTARVFHEGERPEREETMGAWWRRTVSGPLDDDYFAWMASIGLAHVLRGVTNPMMLAMTDHLVMFVFDNLPRIAGFGLDLENRPTQAEEELAQRAAFDLAFAVSRLGSTMGAVVAHSAGEATGAALYEVAGMSTPLLTRLRDQEIAAALERVRGTGLGAR
jgi:hypothetical protein